MSYITRRIHGDEELVNVLYVGLVSDRVKHVVLVRRNSIELFNLDHNLRLNLRKKVPVWETVIDCQVFKPFGDIPRDWLLLATDSNKLILVGFKQNLDHVIIEEFSLNEDGGNTNLSILPDTLRVDSSNNISFYTREGTLCIYEAFLSKDNFERAYARLVSGKGKASNLKLFNRPLFFGLSASNEGSPMLVESISVHDGQPNQFSVLYRNSVYKYYTTSMEVSQYGQLDQEMPRSFEEDDSVSSVTLPLGTISADLYFTSYSIIMRPHRQAVRDIVLDESLQNANESSIKKSTADGGESGDVFKTVLGVSWKISSAIVLEGCVAQGEIMILFTDATGKFYLSKIQAEPEEDENFAEETGTLILKSWNVNELKSEHKLFTSIRFITQLDKYIFLLSSPLGLQLVRIDFNSTTYDVLQTKKASPPILDFNITGTNIPKIQTVGGDDLNSGLIRTEFKGFEKNTTSEIKIKLGKDEKISDFWKLGNILILNELTTSSFKILEISGDKCHEIDDFHNLASVNGSILDLKLIENFEKLLVVTDSGIFKDGEILKKADITNAVIGADNEVLYSTKNSIVYRDIIIRHSEEISDMSYISKKSTRLILVGNWDGSVFLYTNGTRKQLLKSSLAIRSVLIKKLSNDELIFIAGDGEGNVVLINELFELTKYKIGESPVQIVDFEADSFIGVNSENVIKFDFIGGVISQRGYLRIDPNVVILKQFEEKLFLLEKSRVLKNITVNSEIAVLSDESILPRLVRKSISFPNHLNLSVFITVNMVDSDRDGSPVIQSQIEVIENNSFNVKSVFRMDEGIEITDAVNLKYRKDFIDSYDEEDISLGYEKVLSQCFVVSCISHLQDMKISPIKLFTVDETGKIQYQCSSAVRNDEVIIYSLANHANRLVVGAGNVVTCYKVEYSVVNSRFSISDISVPFKPRYFISNVKSHGPGVIVSDVIEGLKLLELKAKGETGEYGLALKFVESKSIEVEKSHFLTTFEIYQNMLAATDSLGNVILSLINNDYIEVLSQFNINDKINVIKKIEHKNLTTSQVSGPLEHSYSELDKIVPLFALGSVNGCVYLVSLITDDELKEKMQSEQSDALQKVNPICYYNGDKLLKYEEFKKTKGATHFTHGNLVNYVDGDLLKDYGSSETQELVDNYCVLL